MELPPKDISGTEVLKFPAKPREKPDGNLMLVPPPFGKCNHFHGPFEVDQKAGDCKCLRCGERVTAIFVLGQLMNLESQWMRTRAAYQDEMKRINERKRTKCEHCKKMTRISHR